MLKMAASGVLTSRRGSTSRRRLGPLVERRAEDPAQERL